MRSWVLTRIFFVVKIQFQPHFQSAAPKSHKQLLKTPPKKHLSKTEHVIGCDSQERLFHQHETESPGAGRQTFGALLETQDMPVEGVERGAGG